jgi:hypothetical protein
MQPLDPAHQPIFRRMLAYLDQLPSEERVEAILKWIGVALNGMDMATVVRVRAGAAEDLRSYPELLDLIDGNLALREIQAQSDD